MSDPSSKTTKYPPFSEGILPFIAGFMFGILVCFWTLKLVFHVI